VTGVVLQARIDSSRLPQKALLPLGEAPLLFRVMEALKGVPCDCHVLACPGDSVSALGPWAEKAGFELVPGSKDDVLGRYGAAARRFHLDRIIRATGDNPFVFVDAAVSINREAAALGADYAGYGGLPHGAGVESVAAEALFRAEREAAEGPEREHVCPYLYKHPERFLLHRPLAPLPWRGPSLRITVDTPGDYERAVRLYRALAGVPGQERRRGETVIRVFGETFGIPQNAPGIIP
jgi:spore coat polysaccharide biosynthesis protein SpsF